MTRIQRILRNWPVLAASLVAVAVFATVAMAHTFSGSTDTTQTTTNATAPAQTEDQTSTSEDAAKADKKAEKHHKRHARRHHARHASKAGNSLAPAQTTAPAAPT